VRVALQIAAEEEIIGLHSLADTGDDACTGLGEIGDAEPVFLFLRAEGKLLFVYSCPGTCKVKRKMLYSSARNGFLAAAAQECGVKPDFRQEVGGVAEVTLAYLKGVYAPAAVEADPVAMGRPGGKARSRPPRGS